MKSYEQIVDGKGYSFRSRQWFRLACCDCGLVHRVAVVAGRGWVGLAMKRDKRATAARRRSGSA
jgi:hypothetical protein